MSWTHGVLAVFVVIVTASLAQEEPKLVILPSEPKIRRDLGKTGFFTCKAADGFEELIEDVVWVDPQGVEVPTEQQSVDQPTPRISTGPYKPGQGRELFFQKIMEQDSGLYTCKARYATSQEISKSFELVVYMSIRWEDAPEDQNPIRGSQAKIKCVVRANPVAVVEWFKDGRAITSGGRYVVEQDGLVIQNITSDDDGTYICRAKVPDEGELQERQIQVEVHSAPKIVEPEAGAEFEVVEKEQHSIPCRTTGKPVPTITWVNPLNADAAAVDGLSVDPKDGTLNFDPATRDMGGEYKCIAENAVGREERAVNVVVIVKPEIVRYENVTVNENSTAVLECKVSGSPLPQVTFRKLGNDAHFEEGTAPGDGRVTVTQRDEDGFRIGSLTVRNLTRADDGLYECIATSKGGREIKNGHITTQFRPSFENAPMREIYSWIGHPVNLTCVAESIPNATIRWEFKNRLFEKDIDDNIVRIGEGPTSVLRVTPQDSTYFGEFTCRASNILGQNTMKIDLFEATVPSSLTDVRFEEVTATTIRFSMNGPSSDGGLPIKAYAVQYKKTGESWDSKQEQLWPVGTSYVLDNLQPEQAYEFRFAATNEVGLAEWSRDQTMVMPRVDVPAAPRIMLPDSAVKPEEDEDMVVQSVFPDSYTVQWQAGANNGEKIDNFEISYYEVTNTKTGWRSLSDKRSAVVDFPGTHTFRLADLKPQTHYRIEVRAHNKMGFGKPAELIVQTAPADTSEEAPASISRPEPADAERPRLASSALVGVIIGVLLVLVLLVDLTCYAVRDRGITHALCTRARGRHGEAKIGQQAADSEKEPLKESKNGHDATTVPQPDSEVLQVDAAGEEPQPSKDSAV